MIYGVVAPGISGVYDNFDYVKRIHVLYPYCKFRKFKTESEAWDFVKRNENKHSFTTLTRYGDTFDSMYVRMEYFIEPTRLCYNFRTEGVGNIKLVSDKAIVDNRRNLVMAEIRDMHLNPGMISAHMIAIYHGLDLLGDYLDVDIVVNNHSTYYALMSYTGNSRVVRRTTDKVKSRLGNISVTLRIEEDFIDELKG